MVYHVLPVLKHHGILPRNMRVHFLKGSFVQLKGIRGWIYDVDGGRRGKGGNGGGNHTRSQKRWFRERCQEKVLI